MLDIKIKVSDVAKELGVTSKEVVAKANEIGLVVKAANSSISEKEAESLAGYIVTGVFSGAKKEEKSIEKKEIEPKQGTLSKSKKNIVENEIKQSIEVEKKEEVKVSPVVIAEESLSTNIINKRRKLHIVKKKRPIIVQKEEKLTPKVSQFNDLLSVSNDNSSNIKKSKKKKKSVSTLSSSTKSKNSMRLDLDRELSDISIGFENEVQLDTFDQINEEISREEEAKKKALEDAKRKANNNNNQQQRRRKPKGKQTLSRKIKKRKIKKVEIDEVVTDVTIPEEVRVYEFAEATGKSMSEVITVLFKLGLMVTKNDFLDKDSIEILAEEFEINVTIKDVFDELDYEKDYEEEVQEDENKESRPPVITIMGHVDHGKTSLLDKIRSTKVTAKEHGGITQHIGAYSVSKNGKDISFLDTPGHEAFSAMRARGARATDIVVIVVAADDGVKPQTKESIKHAQDGKIPFIIAINKMDKEGANPEHAKSQLAELNVVPVEWGGEIEFVEVSAHTGKGIDDLLELILLQSEMLELEASPTAKVKSIVVESSLEKGLGPVATVIVQNGTLKVGSIVVCGVAHGKVRAIKDENNKPLKEVHSGYPAVITGLSEVPNAGDILVEVENDKIAREFATKKADYLRQKELSKSTKVTLDELNSKIADGQIKSLPVILKADVFGSLEALKSSLEKIRNDEVKVNVIHASVGGITQNDLALAEASENAVIVGFQVRPTGSIKQNAKSKGISINTYNIIYELIDDIKGLLSGMLSPVEREEYMGQAEVRETFKVPKLGLVAGCMVTDGVMKRGASIRVIREGVVIYEGEVSTLKRFKDDAKEVKKGFECGLGVVGYTDVKVGDFLESYKMVQEKATIKLDEN